MKVPYRLPDLVTQAMAHHVDDACNTSSVTVEDAKRILQIRLPRVVGLRSGMLITRALRGNRRADIVAGCGGAALSVVIFAWWWHGATDARPDFDIFYQGALAVRNGADPYSVHHPGWPARLSYPLPALLVVMPLIWLPIRVAGAVFVGWSGFALGYALSRAGGKWRYALFGSGSFIVCAGSGQWTALLLASVWVPAFGFFGVAKPNVGIVVAAHWRRWRQFVPAVAGGVVLTVIAFAVRPTWLGDWRAALGSAPYQRAPIRYPGGVLVLLALVRWRRPEATYLLTYAVIPQTPTPYSDLLLFAIPETKWEVLGLAMLSHLAGVVTRDFSAGQILFDRLMQYGGISTIMLMLPCVLMILRRPNRAQ